MTRITRILISSFADFFIVNELHEPHGLFVSFVSFDDFFIVNELLVSFVSFDDHLMTRTTRILVCLDDSLLLRALRVLRWQHHHHVRCFTHLFYTFIGGKFEVFFRDLNHKTIVRPP